MFKKAWQLTVAISGVAATKTAIVYNKVANRTEKYLDAKIAKTAERRAELDKERV